MAWTWHGWTGVEISDAAIVNNNAKEQNYISDGGVRSVNVNAQYSCCRRTEYIRQTIDGDTDGDDDDGVKCKEREMPSTHSLLRAPPLQVTRKSIA